MAIYPCFTNFRFPGQSLDFKMANAMAAAPKPLSMFTTATPLAQLFNMASKGARPLKLAP
jgi:hypothetical protein